MPASSDTPLREKPRNLGILVFDDVEVLDFCGPFEVFSVANKVDDPPGALNVFLVAESPRAVTACGGLSVNADYSLADAPAIDILLVPGGIGTRWEMKNAAMIDWITQVAGQAELVLSVCTGALLLGRAGLLHGLDVTTHHTAYDLLRQEAPGAHVREDSRYIDQGNLITSAGISAGIDMSLHVVQRLSGIEAARTTARQMEYHWHPPES